jgi:hypothetical protein
VAPRWVGYASGRENLSSGLRGGDGRGGQVAWWRRPRLARRTGEMTSRFSLGHEESMYIGLVGRPSTADALRTPFRFII